VNFLKLYKDIMAKDIKDKDTIIKFVETVTPEFLRRRAADRNAAVLYSVTIHAPEITGLLLKKMGNKLTNRRKDPSDTYIIRGCANLIKMEVLESIKKYCTYDDIPSMYKNDLKQLMTSSDDSETKEETYIKNLKSLSKSLTTYLSMEDKIKLLKEQYESYSTSDIAMLMLKSKTEEYVHSTSNSNIFYKIFGTKESDLSKTLKPDILVFESEDKDSTFIPSYKVLRGGIFPVVVSFSELNLMNAETLQDYIKYFKHLNSYYILRDLKALLNYNRLIKQNFSEFMYEILKFENVQEVKKSVLDIAASFGFIDEAYLLDATT